MNAIIFILVYFCFLQFTYFLVRDRKILWGILVAIVGPLTVFTIAYLEINDLFGIDRSFFIWVKICSLITALGLIWIIKFTRWIPDVWSSFIVRIALFINIGEAVVRNAVSGLVAAAEHAPFSKYHLLINAFCGLCVMMALPRGTIVHREYGSKIAFKVNIPWIWIAAYLCWNWTFIFLEYPGSIGIQTAIITSSLIPALIYGRLFWFEARAITITAGLIFDFGLGIYEPALYLHFTPSIPFITVVSLINITLCISLLYSFWHNRHHKKQFL